MSTIKADTIVASDGTSPVTLTKQAGVKMFAGANKYSSSLLGISPNTASSESLNLSSYSDDGTGLHSYTLVNAMQNTQYVYLSGSAQTNNNTTIMTTATASRVYQRTNDSDSNQTNDSITTYCALLGDLA